MLWFKHMANSSSDPFIADLEENFGLEGYARWFKLLEVVALECNNNERDYAAYSHKKWCSFLKCKRKVLETFLEHSGNQGKIKTKQNGNILEIKIVNLLKYRQKDLGRTRTDRGQQAGNPPLEKEKEKEKERKDKKKDPNHDKIKKLFHELNAENWLNGSNSFSDFKATCETLISGGMIISEISSAWVRYAWANEFNTSDDGLTSFLKLFKNAMNIDDAATWSEMPVPRLAAIRREFSDKNTNGSKMGLQRSFDWVGDRLGEDGNKARPARIKEPSATSQGEEPDLKPAIEIVSKAQAFLTEKFPEVNGEFKFDVQPNYVILKFASKKKMPLPFLSADFDKKIRAYCYGFEKIVSGEIGINEFKATLTQGAE